MTPDGEPAPGNPFPDSPVYSLGHRNVQGLAWDGKQRLFASEFGQDTWDELNAINPGDNYGWPERGQGRGLRVPRPPRPVEHRRASPSGIAYAEGSVSMAGLRGERLWRIPLKGTAARGRPGPFWRANTAERTVAPAGGDKLWLVTSNTPPGRRERRRRPDPGTAGDVGDSPRPGPSRRLGFAAGPSVPGAALPRQPSGARRPSPR
ncbi:hypothetical protein SVIOM342S_00404 [Streptomyces violaceorubidus]